MRQSKRIRCEAPTPVAKYIAEAIASNPNKRALKASLTSGGSHGRLKKNPESDWTLDIPAVQAQKSPLPEPTKREQKCITCTDQDCSDSIIDT